MSDGHVSIQDDAGLKLAQHHFELRQSVPLSQRAKPLGWWYHAKKSASLFPGITKAVSAKFLSDHYRARAKQQSTFDTAVNTLTYGGFKLWIGWRAQQVAKRHGLSNQWAANARIIARTRFADPNDLALFRIEQANQLDHYMRRFEYAALNRMFNPANWKRDCLLANKIDFYLYCMIKGLPAPAFHGFWSDGETIVIDPDCGEQVILKPHDGEGGDGVEVLNVPERSRSDADAMARWITAQCQGRKGQWIVQEKMETANELRPIALNALPTMRVTTFINEAGEPEIVTSVLRFPADPNSRVDNIKSGGLMAPIDPETGLLGQGCKGRGLGDYDTHPASDAPITGRVIDCWTDARALVIKAHKSAFSQYSLVGWDIAPTTRSPVIIEGNGKPCAIVAQRASRKGIGETRFGEIMAWHLKQAREAA